MRKEKSLQPLFGSAGVRADIILFVSLVFGIVLAMSLPSDVLTRTPSLRVFTDWMAVIPSIGYLQQMSSFPEVTRLFFSVMWVLVPIQALALLRVQGLINIEKSLLSIQRMVSSRFMAHVSLVLVLLLLIVFPIVLLGEGGQDDGGWMVHEIGHRLMSSSRFWLGALGSGLLAAMAAAICIFLMWVVYLFNNN